MDMKDFFETDGIAYNPSAESYIMRIKRRNRPLYAQVILDEKLNKDFGKLIRPSKVSSLAWGMTDDKGKRMSILSFNVPEEGIAYKMIFDYTWSRTTDMPIKIFSSTEEGKWTVVREPSEDLIHRFKEEREKISDYVQKPSGDGREKESPPISWNR